MSGGNVTSAGGLLPRDLLDRVVAGDTTVPGMDPTDYGLAPGERLTDAITRSWNRLQGVWDAFVKAEAALPPSDTTATSLTRDRWLRPLFDELGFAGLPLAKGLVVDGKEYPISHRWDEQVPIHLLGARVPIDRASRGVAGAARTSPHGLVQEFLNRSPSDLWGVVTNGLVLRLLRDNASLTRQAFVEFDLAATFNGDVYSDFVVLWLCLHRTRFEGEPVEKCFLEQWAVEAASAGTRALDRLRVGVEAAITELGEGFLAHPANTPLREALGNGALTAAVFQRQLLRLVYRLLFLLVAESRDLLLAPSASATQRQRYQRFYSLDRLRTLAARRRGSPHGDLWEALQVTMRALGSTGQPELGLAPLGSFLWSPAAIGALDAAAIDNRHLLGALRSLCFVHDADAKALRPVDYRNLGAEELGSVYEALLELHAVVDVPGRAFALSAAAGNERKTTGSYYTPSPLIASLLDSALDPVLDEAQQAPDPEAALLALRVIDPATGSGHFLIAAAHRIAGRLASVRAGGAEPAPHELREALRDVIGRCLYGIDVNPMAVELCKVSLWLEATTPGRPLSFLNHRIVCGNSLLGATPALIEAGLPDDAFKPIQGDDKVQSASLRKRNKRERVYKAHATLALGSPLADDAAALAKGIAAIDEFGDDDVAGLAAKEARLAELHASAEARRARLVADAWCAAFVAPKTPGAPSITSADVRRIGEQPSAVPDDVHTVVREMAEQYQFLHLHVAFPDVFTVPGDLTTAENQLCGWNGGFDVVLGNPPWDQIQYDPRETFAVSHPEIADAPTMTKRNRMIEHLRDDEPSTYEQYLADIQVSDATKNFFHASGRYPLGSVGRLNTAPLFVELMWNSISPVGRVGVITPTGIATDSFTQEFFRSMVDRASLVSLFDFENRNAVFPGVHRSYKFSLLTLSGDDRPIDAAEFVFFALEVADLGDPEKRFTLAPDDFGLLNPNTRTCPVFRTRRDAEITKAIYRRVPVLVREGDPDGNPWSVKFQLMFMMNTDSHLFRTREELEVDGWTLEGNHFTRGQDEYLPLYQGLMTSLFDHRAADIVRSPTAAVRQNQPSYLHTADKCDPQRVASPIYWVPGNEAIDRLPSAARVSGLLGVCDVTSATNERTILASVVPPSGAGHSLPLLHTKNPIENLEMALNSMAVDYVARQKVGGNHLTFFILKQLPIVTPQALTEGSPIFGMEQGRWARPRLLELTYTAWDMAPFAADLEYHGPPFRWDEERRALLRAELDALMFRLYGIERDDVDYILDTFPIVRRHDERDFGEYRTKRLILERFDAMGEADAAGRPYETALDPPPADPSVAHPESTRPSWAKPKAGTP